MAEKIRTGFYGGTFDPIHLGHLTMAIELKEAHELDEVWFSPCRVNPHKEEGGAASVEKRIAMIQLAIEGIEGFNLFEGEAKREGPSYTFDTLQELTLAEPNRQFYLIIGDEAVPSLPRWHRVEELAQLVPLLVGRRQLTPDSGPCQQHPKIWEAVLKGMTPTSLMEISATAIRQRLKEGLYCGHLLPAKVLDHIQQHHLYLK